VKQPDILSKLPYLANAVMMVELKNHPQAMRERIKLLMRKEDPVSAILLDQSHAAEEAVAPGSYPKVAPYWLEIQDKARAIGYRGGMGLGEDKKESGGWLDFFGTVVTQVAGPLAQKGLAKENRKSAQATAGSSDAVRQAQLFQAEAQQAAALAQAQVDYQIALSKADAKSRKKVYIGLGIGGGVFILLVGGYLAIRSLGKK